MTLNGGGVYWSKTRELDVSNIQWKWELSIVNNLGLSLYLNYLTRVFTMKSRTLKNVWVIIFQFLLETPRASCITKLQQMHDILGDIGLICCEVFVSTWHYLSRNFPSEIPHELEKTAFCSIIPIFLSSKTREHNTAKSIGLSPLAHMTIREIPHQSRRPRPRISYCWNSA